MSGWCVTAIVPDYAFQDFRNQMYGPWYLAHRSGGALEQDVLEDYYKEFVAGLPDDRCSDEHTLDYFLDWLERQEYGYILMTTGTDSVAVLPVSEYDPEEDKEVLDN